MDTVEESVMIALLPNSDNTEWCNIELPHLTLVYAGLKTGLKQTDFNELGKDAAMLASLSRPLTLQVMARETFGDYNDTDVFRLRPTTELWAMRRAVESWNKSQFPFRPHVTIGPVGSLVEYVPKHIRFDRLLVAWGEEKLTFWLRY